jgi:hypothetical protein
MIKRNLITSATLEKDKYRKEPKGFIKVKYVEEELPSLPSIGDKYPRKKA